MLPSTSMVSEVAVVAVQPTSSLASVQLNSSLQDHIVSVASRCASDDNIVCERCTRVVSDLQSIAAKSYLGPVRQLEDIPQLQHRIDRHQVAQGLKIRLMQTAGKMLLQANPKMDGMAMDVATERMPQSECSGRTVRELAKANERLRRQEMMASVNGPARERVLKGESCDRVARALNITDEDALQRLSMFAIEGPAKQRVLNGEPCNVVAREYGISHSDACRALEMIAVAGPARERIRRGEHWPIVSRQLGIFHADAQRQLEMQENAPMQRLRRDLKILKCFIFRRH